MQLGFNDLVLFLFEAASNSSAVASSERTNRRKAEDFTPEEIEKIQQMTRPSEMPADVA